MVEEAASFPEAQIRKTIFQETMMLDSNDKQGTEVRLLEWIEPEMREMDVRETAFRPHTGGDGEATYPDCTHS